MRKLSLLIIIIAAASLFTIGCGGDESVSKTSQQESAVSVQVSVKALEGPIAETPIILTSAGQSADVKMIESLLKKGGMEYEINEVLDSSGLGEARTLVIAIGGSSKGLGAAGIDAEDEIDRIDALLKEAAAKGLTIIGMHIGGEGRRGELSDKFIKASVEFVDYLIVVEGGDKDGMLSGIAAENDIFMSRVGSIVDSYGALKKAFP
ncbi:MAG: hypothetical protein JEZ04_06745 [Spirochaetales bacterium]|nr:hypothetical protein [Spirochaetales bacterium]